MAKRGRPRKDAAVEAEELPEQEVVPEGGIPAEEAVEVEVKDEKKDLQRKARIKDFRLVKILCRTTKPLLSNAPSPDPMKLAKKLGMDTKNITFSEFYTETVEGREQKFFITNNQIFGALKAVARTVGLPTSIAMYIKVAGTNVSPIGKPYFPPKFPLVRVQYGKKVGGGWRVHEALPAGSKFEAELLIPFELDGTQISDNVVRKWIEFAGKFAGIGANPKDFGKFVLEEMKVEKIETLSE